MAGIFSSRGVWRRNKLIIVDLGGVLVEIRRRDQLPAFDAYLSKVADAERARNDVSLRTQLQNGMLNFDGYVDILHSANLDVSIEEIREYECLCIGSLMNDRIDFIMSMKDCARVVLLSNTHELHWTRIRELGELATLLDAYYLSYRTGHMKPEEEAFKFVLETEDVFADSCILLDDSYANCSAAERLGIHAAWVTDENDWMQVLRGWVDVSCRSESMGHEV